MKMNTNARTVAGFTVTTAKGMDGRTFAVRLVEEGDAYGLDGCLTHREKLQPMVEFYDRSYVFPDRLTGLLGQFVSRYHLATLAYDRGRSRGDNLCLDGGNAAVWTVEGESLAKALDAMIAAHTKHIDTQKEA